MATTKKKFTGKKKSTRAGPKKPKEPRAQFVVERVDPDELQARGLVMPSVGAMLRAGQLAEHEADAEKSAREAGRLRGGSVGAFLQDGSDKYIGTCLRAALARYMGAEPPREVRRTDGLVPAHLQTRLMFAGGIANEDAFLQPLLKGLPAGWTVLREDEYPIAWQVQTGNGDVLATGREDVILVDPRGKPRLLVELKRVSSIDAGLIFDEKAKLKHVIQIANYMLRTGLPGQLWYRSDVIMPIPNWSWITDLLPTSADSREPGADIVEWGFGGFKPTKLRPFLRGYHLLWRGDELWFSRADDMRITHVPTKWAKTPIRASGIDRFYSAVLQQQETRQLANPPTVMELDGTRKSYKECQYCDWRDVCSTVEDDYDHWEELVKGSVHRT